MLLALLVLLGTIPLVSEILIEEFNDGNHSNFASWVAGCYIAIGLVHFINQSYLVGIMGVLPTVAILSVKLIRRMSHAERV